MSAVLENVNLRLGPAANGILLSPWEFDTAEFEPGWRYELINGVLVVSPAPSLQERDPNEELGHRLRTYKEQHPQGSALDFTVSEQDVNIGPQRRRVDRAIWAGLGRLPGPQETPTITVEFVSEGKRNQHRDFEVKRDEYHSAGVREYWIVDRFARNLTVYIFHRGKVTKKTVKERQTYESPLLPGFQLPLADLLKLADRWSDTDE